jgi:hypothetical protein
MNMGKTEKGKMQVGHSVATGPMVNHASKLDLAL